MQTHVTRELEITNENNGCRSGSHPLRIEAWAHTSYTMQVSHCHAMQLGTNRVSPADSCFQIHLLQLNKPLTQLTQTDWEMRPTALTRQKFLTLKGSNRILSAASYSIPNLPHLSFGHLPSYSSQSFVRDPSQNGKPSQCPGFG